MPYLELELEDKLLIEEWSNDMGNGFDKIFGSLWRGLRKILKVETCSFVVFFDGLVNRS